MMTIDYRNVSFSDVVETLSKVDFPLPPETSLESYLNNLSVKNPRIFYVFVDFAAVFGAVNDGKSLY